MLILNAAFLVDRDQVTELDAQVQRLSEIQDRRLAFRYAGPSGVQLRHCLPGPGG
jgi:hypothetical protein